MSNCGPLCLAPTPTQAHCPSCHRTFGGVTGFDRHRRGGGCVGDPAGLGYELVKGVWRQPMSAEELARRIARAASEGEIE